jgi:D-glycero-D-manno-heptose 1,7-bisphosphate phosphatase
MCTLKDYFYSLFGQNGLVLDAFYYCPHHVKGVVSEYIKECDCKKPEPGLLYEASYHLGIDLKSSWIIGDILNDVEAGKRAGCRSILLDRGNETEWLTGKYRVPDFTVSSLQEAAEKIMYSEKQSEYEK